MRWERLFADLEARWEAEQSDAREAEVADRTRWERGQVTVLDRLAATRGSGGVVAAATAAGEVSGVVAAVGADWFVLSPGHGGEVLVPVAAVLAFDGLGSAADVGTTVPRRLGLASALRGISRDRAPVRVDDLHGGSRTGTIDAVGADHLDLAVHPLDEPPRRTAVTGRRTVPFAALAWVRRAPGPVPEY